MFDVSDLAIIAKERSKVKHFLLNWKTIFRLDCIVTMEGVTMEGRERGEGCTLLGKIVENSRIVKCLFQVISDRNVRDKRVLCRVRDIAYLPRRTRTVLR